MPDVLEAISGRSCLFLVCLLQRGNSEILLVLVEKKDVAGQIFIYTKSSSSILNKWEKLLLYKLCKLNFHLLLHLLFFLFFFIQCVGFVQ